MTRTTAIIAILLVSCTTSVEPTTTVVASTTSVTATISRPTVDPHNWSMSELVGEDSLTWDLGLTADLDLLKLVTVQDRVFVMATSGETGGLLVWSTGDGVEFIDHGQVLADGTAVAAIGESGDALMVATRSSADQPPILWSSSDGEEWSSHEIPFETDNPLLRFDPQAVGGTPDLTIVASSTSLDADDFLIDRLVGTVYPQFDDQVMDMNWTTNRDEVLVEVTVPPGLRVARFNGDELALTDEERAWLTTLTGERANLGVDVSVLPTGGDWQTSPLPAVIRAEEIFGTPFGEVLMAGFSPTMNTPTGDSPSVHRTFEGLSWEILHDGDRPRTAVTWGQRLIGPAGNGDHDLLVSDDGVEWVRSGLEPLFPTSPRFAVTHAGVGPAAVVAFAESADWQTSEIVEVEVPHLERDGLTVGLEFEISNSDLQARVSDITITRGTLAGGLEGPPVLYPVPGNADREDLLIDLGARTVTFRDEQGADWLVLGFDELDDLLISADDFRNLFETSHSQALAVSADAEQWELADITPLVGDGRRLGGIGQPGDRALVAVQGPEGFEIWSAVLPVS